MFEKWALISIPACDLTVKNIACYKGLVAKDSLPPHIFYMSNNSYETMLRTKSDQCFIIRCNIVPFHLLTCSGESGAGKTETTKFIVSHLMELCRAGKKSLEENIRKLNPLMEAFGNAKTGSTVFHPFERIVPYHFPILTVVVMNDNSSRFGKYLELKFERTGSVMGGSFSRLPQ
jgi:myosin-3